MTQRNLLIFVGVILAVLLLSMSLFTVRVTEYAVKFRFKEIVASNYAPGLHFQIPLLDNVRKFDKKILTLNYPKEKFLTSEGKILFIDFFMKWQIENIDRFYQATSADEVIAAGRLGEIVKDGLKGAIAQHTLQQVVQRTEFIDDLRAKSHASTAQLGVKLVDVRIKRIDLPDEVGDSVFNRMRQDFAQQAAKLRAEGIENKTRLQSEADRQRTEISAEGNRQSEIVRGEGDGFQPGTHRVSQFRNHPEEEHL